MIVLKRLINLMKGNRLLYVGSIIATALATIFSLITPLITKFAVDTVIGGNSSNLPNIIDKLIKDFGGIDSLKNNLWICGLVIIFVVAIQGVFTYLKGKWSATASNKIAEKVKKNLYDHIQKLPYDYHVKAQTGDLIQRCTSDVDTVRRFLEAQVIELGRSIFIILFSIFFMLSLNITLTLISLIMIPFILLFSYRYFKKFTNLFLQADQKEGELSTVLQENLSGVRVVRAFGREKFETNKFDEKNKEFRILIAKMLKLMAYFWAVSDFLCLMQIGIVLFSGVYMAYAGKITLGVFLVFTTYEGMLLWPIRNLGRILGDFGKAGVSLERIYEILETPQESDDENAIKSSLKGDIVFDNVCFGYGNEPNVIKGMSFNIKCGETIAILGSTGSGKSTIMHMLLRLYDYNTGSIKINNFELSHISKKWLREKIGIVLQEPFLFSKTIIENIKMAKEGATESEIYNATKTASIHHVIQDFEKGYETIVGEKGVTLSGGQKQRVAIARTIIKNCDVLIFDDSLSAVDTETDSQIRTLLKERQKDTTTFIISQRITTLMDADRIFVIEDGCITDSGTHNELINREGLYSRVWKIQTMLEEDFEEEAI